MARLCLSGRVDLDRETFMRRVNMGANTDDRVLRSHTGAVSSSHCFVEES